MSNYEATKYDFDAANLTGIEGIPTATIVPWSSSSVPSGFLECDGAAVSRSTYSALFAIIGTTYGSGDGSSTFNVPDLCDNVPVGKSNNKNVGSTGGANTVANTGNVAGSTANATLSTAQLASHAHPNAVTFVRPPHGNNNPGPNPAVPSNEYTPWGNRPTALPNTGSGSAHSHNMSASFTGDATSVVQPYLTVIYIIKT
jgi:microcystin-dependent protein